MFYLEWLWNALIMSVIAGAACAIAMRNHLHADQKVIRNNSNALFFFSLQELHTSVLLPHSLVENTQSSCFADYQISPLYDHNRHKEACIGRIFQNFSPFVGLQNKLHLKGYYNLIFDLLILNWTKN